MKYIVIKVLSVVSFSKKYIGLSEVFFMFTKNNSLKIINEKGIVVKYKYSFWTFCIVVTSNI